MIKEFGYEYDAVLDKELWKKSKGKVTYKKLMGGICLRSGRDALKVIAREYRPAVVLLPALACDSMVLPFEMYKHEVRFYKLTHDYAIDFGSLYSLIKDKDETVLFLYMDYFGNEAISQEALNVLKEKYTRMVFIEDRTHNLLNGRKCTFEPNYIMASLRKWMNIPDGGLLWPKEPLANKQFGEDTSFCEARLHAQCLRHEFFETGNQNTKAAYRKIFSTVSAIMDSDVNPARMSEYAFQLANKTDWNKVRKQRRENATTLFKILKKISEIRFIQNNPVEGDLYVAFLVEGRDELQSKLSEEGIFNTIIWPISDKQKVACDVAKYTEEHILAAPCDQRYGVADMQYIGSEIVRVINEQQNHDSRSQHSSITCNTSG